MGEIFEFIFGNMFLVILIISGIIGMFSNNREQQQQRPNRPEQPQTRQQKQPRPVPTSTRQETVRQRPKEVVTSKSETEPKDTTVTLATPKRMEEEQKAQMERLQDRVTDLTITDGDVIGEDDFISRQQIEVSKSLSEEQKVLKRDIRRSLQNKGLINGIIMAEILGEPRSVKPYQSVTSNRYKR